MPVHITACERPDVPIPVVRDPVYLREFRTYLTTLKSALGVEFYVDGPDEYLRAIFPSYRRQWYRIT